MVPWFVVGYRVVGECLTPRRAGGPPHRLGLRKPARGSVSAGHFGSWRTNWSNSAMSKRSPMRPSVGRSKKRTEAVAGQDVVHPAQGQRRVRLEDGGCSSSLQTSVRSASTRRLHGRNQQATHRRDTAPSECGAGSTSSRGLRVRAQRSGGPLRLFFEPLRGWRRVWITAAASQGRVGVVRQATPWMSTILRRSVWSWSATT